MKNHFQCNTCPVHILLTASTKETAQKFSVEQLFGKISQNSQRHTYGDDYFAVRESPLQLLSYHFLKTTPNKKLLLFH